MYLFGKISPTRALIIFSKVHRFTYSLLNFSPLYFSDVFLQVKVLGLIIKGFMKKIFMQI
jgi:hypothetical protein